MQNKKCAHIYMTQVKINGIRKEKIVYKLIKENKQNNRHMFMKTIFKTKK